jgi:hypothetical protein
MAFTFYSTVLLVATVILILSLTYVGVLMYSANSSALFPPQIAACPDQWSISSDGSGCVIPASTSKNYGTLSASAYASVPGYYLDDNGNNAINFNNSNWTGINGTSSVCNKQKWANSTGVIWDGITNNNTVC